MNKETILIYKVIKKFIDNFGYSPSYREIAELSLLSSSATIYYHVKKLKESGYIDYIPGKNRTIRIIKELEE